MVVTGSQARQKRQLSVRDYIEAFMTSEYGPNEQPVYYVDRPDKLSLQGQINRLLLPTAGCRFRSIFDVPFNSQLLSCSYGSISGK